MVSRSLLLILSLAAGLLVSPPAFAQEDETGVGQAYVEGGGVFGAGTHGVAALGLAAPVAKYLAPFIEFAYAPLGSYAFTYGLNETGKGLYRSGLIDVNGGIDIRFPNKTHWVPYIGLGAGLLHFSASSYTSGFNSTATINQTRSEFAGSGSLGALYYFTSHVGLRAEVKGYGASDNRLARVTAGVFYQFP